MIAAIVQISDIHIADADNPALFKVEELVGALRGLNLELSGCIIAVSGDITFSGTTDQYTLAERFFREALSRIERDFPGSAPQIVFTPGNHDADLTLATDIRQRDIIDALLSKLDVEGAMTDQWLAVQEPYFEFTSHFGQKCVSNREKLSARREFLVGKAARIAVTSFNTSFLTQNPEVPGKLHLPGASFGEVPDTPADIEIAMFHHPYNWLEPENAISFKKFVESNFDLVLTGHEHTPDAYTKFRPDESGVHFVEASPMHDPRAEHNGFNVIVLDLEVRRWQYYQFAWQTKSFSSQSSSTWTPFMRNRELVDQGFENATAFLRDLTDLGTGFTHPRKVDLRLQDLFVYPTLIQRDLQRKIEGKNQQSIRLEGKDIHLTLAADERVLILGSDLSGKTALSKMLYRDLQRSSKLVPLLLTGTDFVGSTSTTQILDEAFSIQYSKSRLEEYHQLPKDRKCILVDDIHRVGHKRLIHVLEECERLFGTLILLADDRYEIDTITAKGGNLQFLPYRQYRIQEFGRPARAQLIGNWLALGRSDVDSEELFKEIAAREKITDTVLGQQLLPSQPIIIIGILQTLEASRNLSGASGSYGELYEAFITDRLATISKKASDLGTKYTLLSRIGYWLFANEAESLTHNDLADICREYFREYRIQIDPGPLTEDLLFAQIVKIRDGNVGFKYRYYYHFFVARYFKENLADASVGSELHERLQYMADRIFYEDYQQVLVFYLYFTKDPALIAQLLDNAEAIYRGRPPADFESDVVAINKLYISPPKTVELPSADLEGNRNEMRRRLDDAEASGAAPCGKPLQYSDDLDDLPKITIALRTLFILGQVLRNFPGSLRHEIKFRIAQQCYLLGLRVFTVVVSSISEHTDEFRLYFSRMMKQVRPSLTSLELAQSAEEAILTLVEYWAFGMIKTISQAVGMEDLTETYKAVIEAHADSLSVQLIDLTIKLDHYGAFPERQVDNLERRVRKNTFGYCVLRHLVVHYFYIYRSEASIRQKYCDRFGIQTRNTLRLSSGLRKT